MAVEKKAITMMLLLVVVMGMFIEQAECWTLSDGVNAVKNGAKKVGQAISNAWNQGTFYVKDKMDCYPECRKRCQGTNKDCMAGCFASCLPQGYISTTNHRRHHHNIAPAPSVSPKLQSTSTVGHTAQGPAAASNDKSKKTM